MKTRIIIALGGNALVINNDLSLEGQLLAIRKAIIALLPILNNREYEIVITHGNGPQVGAILEKEQLAKETEKGSKRNDFLTINAAVAATQATIGHMISQVLLEEGLKTGIPPAVTVLTRVEISETDPELQRAEKPIGPWFFDISKEELEKQNPGWTVLRKQNKDGKWGCRRGVPSPRPLSIGEAKQIETLLESGNIVVACGGGGIPVMCSHGKVIPVEGVVDKDHASACLGKKIGAEILLILTDVERVCVNFGTPQQEAYKCLSADLAEELFDAGQFAPGSMGPKIQAAIDFLKGGGKKVFIASLGNAAYALRGKAGTRIM